MNVEVNPKRWFQENELTVRDYRVIVDNPVFQSAVIASMAEFALRCNPTTEELMGARHFLAVLLNIGEVPQPAAEFPVKRLASPSAERPPAKPNKPEAPK